MLGLRLTRPRACTGRKKPAFYGTHREKRVQVVSECVLLFASDGWTANSAARTPTWRPDPNLRSPGARGVPVSRARSRRPLSLPAFPRRTCGARRGPSVPSAPARAGVPVPTWAGRGLAALDQALRPRESQAYPLGASSSCFGFRILHMRDSVRE